MTTLARIPRTAVHSRPEKPATRNQPLTRRRSSSPFPASTSCKPAPRPKGRLQPGRTMPRYSKTGEIRPARKPRDPASRENDPLEFQEKTPYTGRVGGGRAGPGKFLKKLQRTRKTEPKTRNTNQARTEPGQALNRSLATPAPAYRGRRFIYPNDSPAPEKPPPVTNSRDPQNRPPAQGSGVIISNRQWAPAPAPHLFPLRPSRFRKSTRPAARNPVSRKNDPLEFLKKHLTLTGGPPEILKKPERTRKPNLKRETQTYGPGRYSPPCRDVRAPGATRRATPSSAQSQKIRLGDPGRW